MSGCWGLLLEFGEGLLTGGDADEMRINDLWYRLSGADDADG